MRDKNVILAGTIFMGVATMLFGCFGIFTFWIGLLLKLPIIPVFVLTGVFVICEVIAQYYFSRAWKELIGEKR